MPNEIIEEDNLEIYTPEIGNSEEIGIDQTTTSYSDRLNKLKEGEVVQVKLNEKAIKWRISHDLYKDFKSGVRELFQNEARACRQAQSKYNAKPKIEVRLNPDTKNLVIHGIDSLGISEAVFDNVLRVLGVSGNTDGGNEVGQFGMGFASYTTLSDIVMVETWFRENRSDGSEQRYAFLGDNGIDFKILPEPELETHGTKLSLTYGSQVDERGVVDMISECAKFCGVKVELVIESNWNEYHEYGKTGIYDLEVYDSIKHCLDTQIQNVLINRKTLDETGNRNWEESESVKFFKKIHIDNDDYEFLGYIGITGSFDSDYNKILNGTMNYHLLAGVPIEINFNLSGKWTCYALNIKNERKFMPTADRDRLTKDAEESIQMMFNDEIKQFFDEYKLDSVSDYVKTMDKVFYDHYSYFERYIDKDVFEDTSLVLNTLNRRFDMGSSRNRRSLRGMLATGKPVIRLKALKGDYIARLNTVFDEAIFFRLKRNDLDEERYNKTLEFLESAGVIMGEEYIKEHKIRPLTKKEKKDGVKIACADKPVRIWNSGYQRNNDEPLFGQAVRWGRSYISSTVGKINDEAHDKMLILDSKDKDLFEYIKVSLYDTNTNYVIMKDIKGLDKDEITSYSEWINDNKEKEITYVNGETVKVKDLKKLNEQKDFDYIEGDVKATVKLAKDTELDKKWDNVIVIENNDDLFEIKCAMKDLGLFLSYDYELRMETLIEETSGFQNDYVFYCNENQKKLIYSKLPYYKLKCNEPLFQLALRAIANKPYDFEDILSIVDDILKEQE